MKKIKIAVISALIVSLLATVAILASSYDSTTDPVVSLSYLNDVFAPNFSYAITSKIGTMEEEMKSSVASAASYEAIYLTQGQKIMAYSSCELILRTGSALIIAPVYDVGLSDTTSGEDLLNDVQVPKNHNLIIPRGNDGRGIVITSPDAYIMVRGGYTVEEAE